MAVHAGKFPGSASPVRDFTKSGNPRSSIIDGGMEWDLSTGWHATRPKGWKSKVKRTQKGKLTLDGWDGQKYDIYAYGGFDDYVGFHAKGENHPEYDQLMATAEHAFDSKRPDHEEVISEKGCGHIAQIEYATRSQILRVTFWNGSKCLYFRLPTVVAGQLIYFAQTKQTMHSPSDGKARHALGIYFWELVRIRGQQHGSRYSFEYENRADGKLARHSERHRVALTRDMAMVIMGSNTKRFAQLIRGIKAGGGNDVTLSVTLDDEEYAKYIEELAKLDKSKLGSGYHVATHKAYSDPEAEEEALSKSNLDNFAGEYQSGGARPKVDYYTDSSLAKIENELERVRNSPTYQMAHQEAESMGLTDIKADVHALKEAASDIPGLLSNVNLKNGQLKGVLTERDRQRVSRTAEGAGAIRSWYNENMPAKYNARFMGRTWTIEQLKDFANPVLANNISLAHSQAYKRLVADKNWDGALDFLKNHGALLQYTDEKTHKVINYGKVNYASPYDEIDYKL